LWDAGAEVLEGATALFEAGVGFLVFFTFLTFLVGAGAVAVWPELFCPGVVEAADWAANVKGMAATANPIANSVFFISFLPCGPYCPLTISYSGRPPGNSIASAG